MRRLFFFLLLFGGMVIVWRGNQIGGAIASNVGNILLDRAWRKMDRGQDATALVRSSVLALHSAAALDPSSSNLESYGLALATGADSQSAQHVWQESHSQPDAYFFLGEQARLQGNAAAADRWYEFGHLIEPDRGEWYLFKAREAVGAEAWITARAMIDLALAPNRLADTTSTGDAWYLKGEIFRNTNEPARARQAYLAVLMNVPEHYPALVRLADLAWDIDRDGATAVALWERARKVNPGVGWAYQQLAKFYLQTGDEDAASESLTQLLQVEPENAWAVEQLQRLDRK